MNHDRGEGEEVITMAMDDEKDQAPDSHDEKPEEKQPEGEEAG